MDIVQLQGTGNCDIKCETCCQEGFAGHQTRYDASATPMDSETGVAMAEALKHNGTL